MNQLEATRSDPPPQVRASPAVPPLRAPVWGEGIGGVVYGIMLTVVEDGEFDKD